MTVYNFALLARRCCCRKRDLPHADNIVKFINGYIIGLRISGNEFHSSQLFYIGFPVFYKNTTHDNCFPFLTGNEPRSSRLDLGVYCKISNPYNNEHLVSSSCPLKYYGSKVSGFLGSPSLDSFKYRLLPSKEDLTVIDAKGNWVMPGLMEAHCHMGISEEKKGMEGDD